MTNLVRAGLARLTNSRYAPLPTVYDGLFPNGTYLTAPTARAGTSKIDPNPARNEADRDAPPDA